MNDFVHVDMMMFPVGNDTIGNHALGETTLPRPSETSSLHEVRSEGERDTSPS